jgi:histidinol phosphatase-like PHP family hydrolase
VDIIGHPGGTYFHKFGPFPVQRLEPVFVAAREHDVAIELSGKYCWDLPGMLRLFRRTNPWITCGSDAHHSSEIGLVQRLMERFDKENPSYMERRAG